jgi:hypothetical protein
VRPPTAGNRESAALFYRKESKRVLSLQSVLQVWKQGFVKKGSDTNVKYAITVRKLGKGKPQRFWWMAFALG